jgi:hypothetical protein
MASGAKTLTGGGGSEVIIAADARRNYILIQLQSNHPVYLGFGEAAVNAQGLSLMFPGDWARARGPKATKAIYGISTGNAVLGYETYEEVEYGSGQFAGPWPVA